MGDYTWGCFVVSHCPPERVKGVLNIIAEYGLTTDGGPLVDYAERHKPSRRLDIGAVYSDDDFRCGNSVEIAHEIITMMPDVAFSVREDPKYEWLGTYIAYTPQLGRFEAPSDSDGIVVLGHTEVRRAVDAALEASTSVAYAIDRLYGVAWDEALRHYETVSEQVLYATDDEEGD